MRIGYNVGEGTGAAPDLAEVIERGKRVEAAGLDTAWIPHILLDSVTASAALGLVTERIEIGTAVIPTPSRHPFAMATQAATAQQACGGRFTLGVGLSHKVMVEGVWGLSFERPVRQMREYLDILTAMLRGEQVDYTGEIYQTHAFSALPLGTPVDVLVAALGPQMRRVTGALAGGTITWASGPKTIEDHIAPTLRAAAREAGRPEPRVVAGFPVVVTRDAEAARAGAVATFAHYKPIPSYRAMLDREGVEGVEDLIVVGDEADVRKQLARLEEIGVTDLCAFPFSADAGSIERTIDLLGDVARSGL
jgi:F420-dependent oxidoreductase-like protein